jgi:hypothetical protein
MRPPTKLQVFADFGPKKCYNPLLPTHSSDSSLPDYFLFLKLKMKLKRLHFADVAEIQEAVTDELKKVQKEELSAAFQKLYDGVKLVYMPVELILYKNVYVYDFLKNQS